MKSFLSTVATISSWSGKIFSFLAVAVMVLIAFEVVARYAFKSPTIWAGEATTYLSGVYYIMGGAYTLLLRGHVKVDMLYDRLATRTKAIVDLVTFPLFFLFFSVLLWTSFENAWASTSIRETTGTSWSPPIYPIKITIPIAAFLILLQGVAKFIGDFYTAFDRGSTK